MQRPGKKRQPLVAERKAPNTSNQFTVTWPVYRQHVLKLLEDWAVRDDGSYEIVDGQQRTIFVAQYVVGDFSINGLKFHNLPSDKQQQILDYKLMIYFCSGTDSEKLEWFGLVRILG